jgi:threonine aldolase
MREKRGFASDNNSGVSPEVIKKISEVNVGHEIGYGDDPYTREATLLFKQHFGSKAIPYFVFTGTAANVLGISAAKHSFNSVICASTSHINEDECGAPEKFSGSKLIAIDTQEGKLTPELIIPHLVKFDFEHHSQPGIISISQPTEMGTLYSVKEIKSLSQLAKRHGMFLHMDGARLANAAVGMNLPFKTFTADAGVDILSFGGTKNGLLAAESVIFFNEEICKHFKYIRKQGMQLASKMRFISAQFIAYFSDDLWKKNATHANKMAQKLAMEVKDMKEVKITQQVESNGVFAIIPKQIIKTLQKEVFFYPWNETSGEVRWMASFDTTEQDIDNFVKTLKFQLSKLN